MALTTAGRNAIAGLIIGTGTDFANANAHLGVGDSLTAFAAGQTDLQAASNKFRRPMEATYPQLATNVIDFKSSFATGEANFAWNEVGVFNAVSAGTMLCRVVQSLGTKVSGTWTLTHSVTVVAA
jgi:hypothetical protein